MATLSNIFDGAMDSVNTITTSTLTQKERTFNHTLNSYFRCNKFKKMVQAFSLYETKYVPAYDDIPENFAIYILQQVKKGLNEDNLMQFVRWYNIEKEKTCIDNWNIFDTESGSIKTDFGIISFQVDSISDSIVVHIE